MVNRPCILQIDMVWKLGNNSLSIELANVNNAFSQIAIASSDRPRGKLWYKFCTSTPRIPVRLPERSHAIIVTWSPINYWNDRDSMNESSRWRESTPPQLNSSRTPKIEDLNYSLDGESIRGHGACLISTFTMSSAYSPSYTWLSYMMRTYSAQIWNLKL